jgi:hypothetical protein
MSSTHWLTSLSSGDSTTGPRPHFWDDSITLSQQPIYNLLAPPLSGQTFLEMYWKTTRSWDSSDNTVSDCRHPPGIRSTAEADNISSSLCVQIGSETHPASYPIGTGVLFPGDKERRRRDADHHPHLVPR